MPGSRSSDNVLGLSLLSPSLCFPLYWQRWLGVSGLPCRQCSCAEEGEHLFLTAQVMLDGFGHVPVPQMIIGQSDRMLRMANGCHMIYPWNQEEGQSRPVTWLQGEGWPFSKVTRKGLPRGRQEPQESAASPPGSGSELTRHRGPDFHSGALNVCRTGPSADHF